MTEVNVESIFSSLENQANTLNNASNGVNKKLEEAQFKLVSLNIGLEYWHSPPLKRSDHQGDFGGHQTSDQFITILGFARVNGNWCLCIKVLKETSGFFEGELSQPFTNTYLESGPTPLLDSPRELRLDVISILPRFLEGMLSRVNGVIEDLTE